MKVPMVFLLGFPGQGMGLKKMIFTFRRFEKDDLHFQPPGLKGCDVPHSPCPGEAKRKTMGTFIRKLDLMPN